MDYQAEAQLTKSDQFHGELVSSRFLVNVLSQATQTLNQLDAIKKALFYGKKSGFNVAAVSPTDADCSSLLNTCFGNNDQKGVDIIHAIIGKATESGELLEALLSAMAGNGLDIVNFKEEIADGQWYDAIGLEAVGSTFAEVQATNIEKLRKRFPNRFTEYDANNRDLFAEREILEK